VRLQKYREKSDKPLTALSLLFLFVLIAQLLLRNGTTVSTGLEYLNWFIWLIFAVDYLICLYLSESKKNWIVKHPLELLIVVVPFFRPLRLLRALPLVMQLFQKGKVNLSGQALRIAFFGLILLIVPATLLLYVAESPVSDSKITNWGDAAWWAITTVTTVGYGDIYPVTAVGRILSAIVMILGISFVGILTASIASWFVQSGQEVTESELSQVLAKLDKLEKEIADIGKSGSTKHGD
jgi:voltage-gated potassium channel